MKKSILALAVSLALAPVLVFAAPGAGSFVLGNGTISTTGTTTNVDVSTIHQAGVAGSSVSLVNWNGFNIGTGETVNMTVSDPSVAQTMTFLNYDPSGAMSQISGTLNASNAAGIARVVVVNPNGVSVNNGAVINTTGGFTAIAGTLAVADNPAVQGGKQINVNLTDGVINIDAGAAVTNQTVNSTTLNLFNDLFFSSPVVRLVADGAGNFRLPVSVGINGGDLFYIDRINSAGQVFDTATGTITNDDSNVGVTGTNMYQFSETGNTFTVNIDDLTLKSSMLFNANSANADYAMTMIGSNVVLDDGRLLIYSDTTNFSAPIVIKGIYGNGQLKVNSNNVTGNVDIESPDNNGYAYFIYGALKTDLLSNGARVTFASDTNDTSAATTGITDFNSTGHALSVSVNNNVLDIRNGFDVNYDGSGVGTGNVVLNDVNFNAANMLVNGTSILTNNVVFDGSSIANSYLSLEAYDAISLSNSQAVNYINFQSNQTAFNTFALINTDIAAKTIRIGASPYRMNFNFTMDENSSLQTIGTGSVSVTASNSVTYGANASQGARGNNTTTAPVINNSSQIADLNTTGDSTDGGVIAIAAKTAVINGTISAGTRDPVVVPPVVTPPVVTPPVVTPPVVTPPVTPIVPTDPVTPPVVTPPVVTPPVTPIVPTDPVTPVTPSEPVTISFEDQRPAPQINFANGRGNDVSLAGRDILLPAPASDNHLVTVNDPRDKTDE